MRNLIEARLRVQRPPGRRMYGSGLADGDRHDHNNLPTLLAGGACGTIRAGRHVRCTKDTPMANLFVAMLDRMRMPVEQFGDSKGKLDYLSGPYTHSSGSHSSFHS